MNTRSPLKPSSAFTLIEILLAIGILALGITAVLSLFMIGARSHQRARDRARAALLADTVIHELSARLPDPNQVPWKDGTGDPWLFNKDKSLGEDTATGVLWLIDRECFTNGKPLPKGGDPPLNAVHAGYPEFYYNVVFTRLNASSRSYQKATVTVRWGPQDAAADPRNSDTFGTILRWQNN